MDELLVRGSAASVLEGAREQDLSIALMYRLIVSVAAKNGADSAGLWPCFRWQKPLPAFARTAGRTIRFCTFPHCCPK